MSKFIDWEFYPEIDWDSPSGELLIEALSYLKHLNILPNEIVLFGSSPLELAYPNQGFASADLDICSQAEGLEDALSEGGFLIGQREPYLDVCPLGTFRTCPDWMFRIERREYSGASGCSLILPHPIDILVSKIRRMEPKDLEAFQRVKAASGGHPTESEMLFALRGAVDLFRPNFDEEAVGDALTGARILWTEFFGKDIDPRVEIIQPAIKLQQEKFNPSAISEIIRATW